MVAMISRLSLDGLKEPFQGGQGWQRGFRPLFLFCGHVIAERIIKKIVSENLLSQVSPYLDGSSRSLKERCFASYPRGMDKADDIEFLFEILGELFKDSLPNVYCRSLCVSKRKVVSADAQPAARRACRAETPLVLPSLP